MSSNPSDFDDDEFFFDDEEDDADYYSIVCSECNHVINVYGGEEPDHCPQCGTDFD